MFTPARKVSSIFRFKIFYGWYIVVASSLVAAFYGAIFTYGWTAFVGPIATQFGWSMAQISVLLSAASSPGSLILCSVPWSTGFPPRN